MLPKNCVACIWAFVLKGLLAFSSVLRKSDRINGVAVAQTHKTALYDLLVKQFSRLDHTTNQLRRELTAPHLFNFSVEASSSR